jgi:hypothetical protein
MDAASNRKNSVVALTKMGFSFARETKEYLNHRLQTTVMSAIVRRWRVRRSGRTSDRVRSEAKGMARGGKAAASLLARAGSGPQTGLTELKKMLEKPALSVVGSQSLVMISAGKTSVA